MLNDKVGSLKRLPPQVRARIYDPAESTRCVRIIMASGLEYCSVVTVARIEAIGQSVDDIDVICHDLPEESHIEG